MTYPRPAPRRATRPALSALLALSLAPTGENAQAVPGPWQRTEARQPCASFELFRQPYFGDTHVHTAYSSDAVFAGTRENPRGAYRFAQGQPIGLPPYDAQGMPTRTAQLRRPLDFTAVTDHAEQFGEIQLCLTAGLAGYDSADCVAARDQLAAPLPALPNLLPPPSVIAFLLGYGVASPPQRFSWCGPDGTNCLAEASLVWQDTQAAAEEFYDRTAACTFTTFVAYEWSGQPGGNNLHRNVIFRNAVVPALPTSYMEQPTPGLERHRREHRRHPAPRSRAARSPERAVPHASGRTGPVSRRSRRTLHRGLAARGHHRRHRDAPLARRPEVRRRERLMQGQLAFVAAMLIARSLLGRWLPGIAARSSGLAVYAMGVLSAFWCFERVAAWLG